MLQQPCVSEPRVEGRAETWVVLATERRKEFNAAIFALNGHGKAEKSPGRCALFSTREAALEWLSRPAGKWDHAAYTYTAFRLK